MCQHCVSLGDPFSPTGVWIGSFPRMGYWGVYSGLDGFKSALWGKDQLEQGCFAVWPLTAHGGGIITLSQILLDVREEHITGAGPGLVNARVLIPGLLTGLLKSPPCSARLYRSWVNCQWHTDVQDAAMAHTSLLQLCVNPRQCFILPCGMSSSISALPSPALVRGGAVVSQLNGGRHLLSYM